MHLPLTNPDVSSTASAERKLHTMLSPQMCFPCPDNFPINSPEASGDDDKAVEHQLFDKLIKKALHNVEYNCNYGHLIIYLIAWSVGAAFLEHSNSSGRKQNRAHIRK